MNNSLYTFPKRDLLSKHIGVTLKKLRKNQHILQADFADLCQLSRNTVSLIETGNMCPSFDVLYRICIVLDISLSEFTLYVEQSLQKIR